VKLLAPATRARLSDAFLEGRAEIDVQDLVSVQGRDVDLGPLGKILQAAPSNDPASWDAWLAPRIHAALRLSRREAAMPGFWMHLAVVDHPEYVRERFPNSAARYTGTDMIHALSRLWWGAELFRVGPDYSPVGLAFTPQDIPNTIFRLRAAHNRVFCVALLKFVATRRTDGVPLIGRQVNQLSTAINSQLFVMALDALAPDIGTSSAARRTWAGGPVDGDAIIAGDFTGPDDLLDEDFEAHVELAVSLLHRFADGAGIAMADSPQAGSRRPGDVPDEPDVRVSG
jgi:hypothetical protein